MLSTAFEGNVGTVYNYNATDRFALDWTPPAAVQITRVPSNGYIVTHE